MIMSDIWISSLGPWPYLGTSRMHRHTVEAWDNYIYCQWLEKLQNNKLRCCGSANIQEPTYHLHKSKLVFWVEMNYFFLHIIIENHLTRIYECNLETGRFQFSYKDKPFIADMFIVEWLVSSTLIWHMFPRETTVDH